MTGTVLLLAAAPAGKGRLVDAASVLPVLAAVAPPVLSGTDTANVVELADPLEPQAVLTRLRAASVAPGPLTLFLTGQLQLDRRQHLPHFALARSTPATVRYTGFPWHWIREELRLRPAGTVTVFADLHADPEMWQYLHTAPLDCGPAITLYGRIASPPRRRAVATPTYMKALATILRSGRRPDPAALHHQALTRAYAEAGPHKDVILAPNQPADNGSWQARYTPPAPAPFTPAPLPAAAPAPSAPHAPLPAVVPAPPDPRAVLPAVAPAPPDRPAALPAAVPAPPDPRAPLPAVVPAPPDPRTALPAVAPALPDPHAALAAAVQDGRHAEAAALVGQWEQAALQEHGPGSEEALHWIEVRADLAMLAGDAGRSCETWLVVATARLSAGQPPEHPLVEAAVDRAHHQWGRMSDPSRARELGLTLADLRERVPGRREGAVNHVHERLRRLQRGLQTQP